MISSQASLQVGIFGTFQDVRYQIIGAGAWNMDYLEYYSGEDGSGYAQAYWNYIEWILFDVANNRVAYLIEDREGFTFSTAYEPVKKIIPKFQKDQFVDFAGKKEFRIIEYGTAYLQEFQGENGYPEFPEPQSKHFYLYQNSGIKYSVEVPLNAHGEELPQECDYYKAQKIGLGKVLEAFKDNPHIQKKQMLHSNLQFATLAARLTAWVLFFLFCYSFFAYSLVFKHTFNITNGTLDSLGMPTRMDTLVEFFSPTWDIKQGNEVYLIETQATLAPMLIGKNPCTMYVQTAIIAEDAGVVNQMAEEFWAETGYDSDGAWSERQTTNSMHVRAEKAGKFSAWLNVERTPDMLEWTATVEIGVHKCHFLWWYVMTYWLIALAIRGVLGVFSDTWTKQSFQK